MESKLRLMLRREALKHERCTQMRTLPNRIRAHVGEVAVAPSSPESQRTTRAGCWRDERGAEMVEAAFVLPILLTLLIGIFWFARAYNIYETITRAAREGARTAAAPSCAMCGDQYFLSDAQTALDNSLTVSGLETAATGETILIQQHQKLNLDPNNPNAQWTVVSITYPFQFNLPFTSLNLSTVNISTKVQMLEEQ